VARQPRQKPPGGGPSPRAQTIAASLVLAVVLALVLADGFDRWICGCRIDFPASAYPLVAMVGFFWFGLKITDLFGRK
jgi:hypothetical protein